jgi:hypothetical protein
VVRAHEERSGASFEITPESERIPSYLLSPELPVRFAVVTRDQLPGAFRIDLRRLMDPQDPSTLRQAVVRYELLDADGKLLHAGLLLHHEAASRHDRVRGAMKGVQVSEPSRHYFRTPSGCAALLFYSLSPGLCLAASTRPESLPRTVNVPEEYMAFERGQDDKRDWFPLRPTNHDECLVARREVFVRVQPRPPGFASLLTAGYEGRSCTPANAAAAYRLMVSASAGAASRPFGASRFARILPGETVILDAGHAPASEWVQPRLVCVKGSNRPARVTLWVDGRIHAHLTAASLSTEWVLAPLRRGRHELRVDADEPCEVYINQFEPPASAAYVERTVSDFGSEPLRYRIEKRTEGTELLSLRLHQPSGAPASHVVRVSLTDSPLRLALPTESWTFAEATYRVRPSEKVFGRLLGTEPAQLSGGELFLFTLGADVEPGWHELTIALEEGPPCLLQAMHIVPGRKDRAGFFVGSDVAAPEDGAAPLDE